MHQVIETTACVYYVLFLFYGSEKIKMATKIKDEYGMILKDHIPSKKEEQAKQKKTSEPLELNPYGVPTQCMLSSSMLSALSHQLH